MLSGSLDHPEVVVNLAAIRRNVAFLRELCAPAAMMTVVKADGYGHGMVEVARVAREAGSEWIGVATVSEALALRAAGDGGRLLCWLDAPGPQAAAAIAADIDVTAYSLVELDQVAAVGQPARVQLKIDTGFSRGGCTAEDWPALVAHARELEKSGVLVVTGIWSHFACADDPDDPANEQQERRFREALSLAEEAGLRPQVRHLSNSAATVLRPSARFDLVRCGIASYGLDPAPGTTPPAIVERLEAAMTVHAPLAMVKRIDAGTSVSYGHTWTAERPTTLGLVPMGYGDGVPRHASGTASVWVAGAQRPIRGRVSMDQFVVDLAGDMPEVGEPVVLFGTGNHGEPTAQDWAEASETINYEIVTRMRGRYPRRYVDPGSQG